MELKNCPDCDAEPGTPHQDGCDIERCSGCGGQKITCGCERKHDKFFARWTGIFPGKAEAMFLGIDLNTFFEKYEKIFFRKIC